MAFGLSFSSDFFMSEDWDQMSPDNIDQYLTNGLPTSVDQALMLKTDDEWDEIARECFDLDDGTHLDIPQVLDLIMDTDTCTDLSSPVTVWIDPDGYFTVDVFDKGDC